MNGMEELKEILLNVQKPARYIGEEINSVKKKHSKDLLKVALAFPDVYEVGMSHLGIKILYHLINERDDCLCERVFAPWFDMESEMRKRGIKLFSLESKEAIAGFDILGFSLSYELTYTNVLNMLALAGISIFSKDRKDEEPFVIAGGACSFNPEPMAGFIDIFFIGDAEETLPLFLDRFIELKKKAFQRKDILKKVSALPGVYVPSLYSDLYENGQFVSLEPAGADIPEKIFKGHVKDFDSAYYPAKQLVPNIDIVHDRIAVEIMRGCPNRCRFCQASAINTPLRIRKRETIRRICMETYLKTGYEQIALLSLSSVNYPCLVELVRDLNADFSDKGVGISVPSLRVDENFYKLPEMMSLVRKSGLTFAPESSSESIRNAMGKDIDMAVLCRSAELAYMHGWKRIKLYFMVGFPLEDKEETEGIMALARDLSRIRKEKVGRPAEISVSVNPFVPKAHTPFQWLGMKEKGRLENMRDSLKKERSRKFKVEFHNPEKSFIEGCLSRGDRRLGRVIHSAWSMGAKMDSWDNYFDFSIWKQAFENNGLEIEKTATRNISPFARLPWDHIETGIAKEALREELFKSKFMDSQKPDIGA